MWVGFRSAATAPANVTMVFRDSGNKQSIIYIYPRRYYTMSINLIVLKQNYICLMVKIHLPKEAFDPCTSTGDQGLRRIAVV